MKKEFLLKIILLLNFLLIFSFDLFGGWGTPKYVWIRTFSIEDYPGTSKGDLNRCHEHADHFADTMLKKIEKYKYNIKTKKTKSKDSSATKSAVRGSTSYEFVFISGHGNKNGPVMYDGTLYNTDHKFGGWNRWVIFDCCLSLNSTKAKMAKRFNGIHAIYGYDSISYEFNNRVWDIWQIKSHRERSEEQWDSFSDKWSRKIGMYDAFKQSVNAEIVKDGNLDVQIACYYVRGTVDGKYYKAHNEKINYMYDGSISLTGDRELGKYWTWWGSPDYD